jgi:retron-type reverse transcriptase
VKTFRNLYPRVWSFENLLLAWRRAARGKRSRPDVASFELRLEDRLFDLQAELAERRYEPAGYRHFFVREPKWRKISAAPFRDRVVHHALCQIIEPIFEARFIADSYACRQGKGTHRALDRCQHFARRHAYVLQCDVQQFFPSVDHAILRGLLARRIKDDDLLWLVDSILAGGAAVFLETAANHWFPGDDLWAAQRPRGLPIGNLTSQFWGNVYLDALDQHLKRDLGCRAYLRYADDFLLFADDKYTLHAWRAAVVECLAGLRLRLHERRAQIFPVHTGIPFLGFRVFPARRRLKSRTGHAYRRRFDALVDQYREGRIDGSTVQASARGWANHARYANTVGLRKAILSRHLPRPACPA